jgi:hypothetical protein
MNEKLHMFLSENDEIINRNPNEAIENLNSIKYSDYLKTNHWREIKFKYKQISDNKCVLCPVNKINKDLHLHHKTYNIEDNVDKSLLGKERYCDLVWLCEEHHKIIHARESDGSMVRSDKVKNSQTHWVHIFVGKHYGEEKVNFHFSCTTRCDKKKSRAKWIEPEKTDVNEREWYAIYTFPEIFSTNDLGTEFIKEKKKEIVTKKDFYKFLINNGVNKSLIEKAWRDGGIFEPINQGQINNDLLEETN